MATTEIQLEFSKDHGYLFLVCSLLCFQYMLYAMIVMKSRKKVFNPEFLKKNFDDVHKKATGEDISKSYGYPDMGNGRYAEKLAYGDWLDFNKAQRIHYNYLEQLCPILTVTLIAGIKLPCVAAGIAFLYLIARFIYLAYQNPKGASDPLRRLAAGIIFLSFFANFGVSVYGSLKLARIC